jgi:hypothetical protein
MAKFIYLYRGPSAKLAELTPEQSAERMAAFGAWLERVGPALVDAGSPFGPGVCVRDDGTTGPTGDAFGFSIVEADDLATATALADGLPILSGDEEEFAVEVFELLPM